jgi:hypothetical protein
MFRLSIRHLLSTLPLTLVLAACGSAGPGPASSPSSPDTCPLLDAGPPPACPEGCAWNGTECRKHAPIIVEGKPPTGKPPTEMRPKQ